MVAGELSVVADVVALPPAAQPAACCRLTTDVCVPLQVNCLEAVLECVISELENATHQCKDEGSKIVTILDQLDTNVDELHNVKVSLLCCKHTPVDHRWLQRDVYIQGV